MPPYFAHYAALQRSCSLSSNAKSTIPVLGKLLSLTFRSLSRILISFFFRWGKELEAEAREPSEVSTRVEFPHLCRWK